MSKIVPSKCVKRPGSAVSSASGSDAKKRSRKLVEISEDVWLEALKHLSGTKWSRMRLVTRHLNGVVNRNVSRLPMAKIDYAAMVLKERNKIGPKIIVADSVVSPNAPWFKNGGIALDVPADIQLNNAIISLVLKNNCCVDLCVLGPAQAEELTAFEKTQPWFSGRQFKAEVIFYAEFGPHRNQTSLASMAFFLKLLYDPLTYVKDLSMYGLDKKLKEILFTDEEKRYIHCGSFKLQMTRDDSVEDICKSVTWLDQNVQADIVQFPTGPEYDDDEICDTVSNYLLSSSWTSASQVVKLGEVGEVKRFFEILLEKFPPVAVQSIFPTVVFSGISFLQSLFWPLAVIEFNNQHFGKWIETLEDPEDQSDDSKNKQTYTISNGQNRMRIELTRTSYSACSIQ